MGVKANRPATTKDLFASERVFIDAMHQLRFGRIEILRIEAGEIVLDPWPATIRHIRFGASDPAYKQEHGAEFRLKEQVAELFEYIRSVGAGEIRTLEVKNGLPFSMQIV